MNAINRVDAKKSDLDRAAGFGVALGGLGSDCDWAIRPADRALPLLTEGSWDVITLLNGFDFILDLPE
jgi:hypothetical protein